ncbi:MAG TPA: DUF4124 domain-containing protein [Steroidobacteraceae bacterium]|nr:DUF4124 domain-containing protein [Steroidobacteraceae bacterium]
MKTSVLILGCLLATASLAQSTSRNREIWEWKDADGVTHYSDAPAPGARKIVIVGSTPTQASAPPVKPAATTPASAGAAKPSAVQYTSLEIWSPENGASFFGADAVVNLRLRSEPELARGDRLLTYLDGKLLPGENLYEHNLSAIERGVHSVTSVILDSQGNEKIRSQPLVFHIKQATTVDNARNKGPAVRPPTPKPGG